MTENAKDVPEQGGVMPPGLGSKTPPIGLAAATIAAAASAAETQGRKSFFDAVRGSVFDGSMTQGQVDGTNSILDAWAKFAPTSDPRFVAYALATAFHETAATMQPVREAYWMSEAWRSTHLRYYPWYGRGFVQLTWEANYEKADARLHVVGVLRPGESVLQQPDLVMRPDCAAVIMVYGMLEGWFTGKRLSDFFHGSFADWGNARTIINGHDCAAKIAHYAMAFNSALTPFIRTA
jgi:putative chitinase